LMVGNYKENIRYKRILDFPFKKVASACVG